MLAISCLMTGGAALLVFAERRALRDAPRRERWIYLGIVAGCYLLIMVDMIFPHSFALSPLLEKLVTGLFPQAAA